MWIRKVLVWFSTRSHGGNEVETVAPNIMRETGDFGGKDRQRRTCGKASGLW